MVFIASNLVKGQSRDGCSAAGRTTKNDGPPYGRRPADFFTASYGRGSVRSLFTRESRRKRLLRIHCSILMLHVSTTLYR